MKRTACKITLLIDVLTLRVFVCKMKYRISFTCMIIDHSTQLLIVPIKDPDIQKLIFVIMAREHTHTPTIENVTLFQLV